MLGSGGEKGVFRKGRIARVSFYRSHIQLVRSQNQEKAALLFVRSEVPGVGLDLPPAFGVGEVILMSPSPSKSKATLLEKRLTCPFVFPPS